MNYLDLVNNVLRRMREDTVDSLYENEQSTVVADLINDAKRIVEDSHDWTAYKTDYTFATAAADSTYSLIGTKNRATIEDVRDLTSGGFLTYVPSQYMRRQEMVDESVTTRPTYYCEDGVDANGDTQIKLWPVPDGIYQMSVRAVRRADDLTEEGSELTIPHMPVIHYAHMMAARERGDVDSNDVQFLMGVAKKSLGDAIMYDVAKQPEKMVWYPI